MDTDVEFETVSYTTPALSVLGTVTGATLGTLTELRR
ncbi:hypothetical protein ACVWZD_000348 [Streptomyces sp. TE3672]